MIVNVTYLKNICTYTGKCEVKVAGIRFPLLIFYCQSTYCLLDQIRLLPILVDLLKYEIEHRVVFEGTGTRDLIWLKVVSLDRSWLVGLMDDL